MASMIGMPPLDLGRARHRVDDRLQALLAAAPDGELRRAMVDATLGGGRRLRAILVLLACHAVGGQADDGVLDLACAVEMVHASSLVLDDLPAMDDAADRRGQPAVHRRHGEGAAILAAVALLARAFAIAGAFDRGGRHHGPGAVEILARAVGDEGMCGGQQADLAARSDRTGAPIPTAALEDLHRGKSGCLTAAACELGALVGGGGTELRRALSAYGMSFGLAYQIVDDIADRPRDVLAGQPNYAVAVGAAAARKRAECLLGQAGQTAARAGARVEPLAAFASDLLGLRPASVAT